MHLAIPRSRKYGLIVLIAALLPASSASLRGQPGEEGRKRPNLLLVTFDTTRADRLAPYGYRDVETPAISRLAREGVLFEHCNAQSPQTLPSHASIFTGQYTITHNVRANGQHLDEQAITLAEILSVEGYRTGAVVATAALLESFGIGQGFKHYDDDFDDPPLTKAFKGFFRFFSRGKVNMTTTRSADRVSIRGRTWIRKAAKRKRPFFLWLHFFDPHSPYVYYPDLDNPKNVREDGPENEHGELEQNYIREIEYADHHLGKVLRHMDYLGLLDDTLVVFTADHGESLGEHGYQGHRQEVYEHISRVPLIFRYPKALPRGKRLKTPAMSIDIAPTTLKLLGVPFPDNAFAGRDLFSLGPERSRERFTLAVKLFTKSPIRTAIYYGEHKFVLFDDPANNQLFNYLEDRDELNNLLGSGHGAEDAIDWRGRIQEWFRRYEQMSVSDFQMTPEQMEALRSLGYIQD